MRAVIITEDVVFAATIRYYFVCLRQHTFISLLFDATTFSPTYYYAANIRRLPPATMMPDDCPDYHSDIIAYDI